MGTAGAYLPSALDVVMGGLTAGRHRNTLEHSSGTRASKETDDSPGGASPTIQVPEPAATRHEWADQAAGYYPFLLRSGLRICYITIP